MYIRYNGKGLEIICYHDKLETMAFYNYCEKRICQNCGIKRFNLKHPNWINNDLHDGLIVYNGTALLLAEEKEWK